MLVVAGKNQDSFVIASECPVKAFDQLGGALAFLVTADIEELESVEIFQCFGWGNVRVEQDRVHAFRDNMNPFSRKAIVDQDIPPPFAGDPNLVRS